jgi:hypothetical protein
MIENKYIKFPKTLLGMGGDFCGEHAGEIFLRDAVRLTHRNNYFHPFR